MNKTDFSKNIVLIRLSWEVKNVKIVWFFIYNIDIGIDININIGLVWFLFFF